MTSCVLREPGETGPGLFRQPFHRQNYLLKNTGVDYYYSQLAAYVKGLSTREAGRGHATPHMPVETAKCWWLLKIEPNALAGGKGSCAVCVDLQAVGALEFFGELYSLAKGFGPIFEGVWAGFREREGSIFSNHQHFAVSTGICGVACPLPASRVDKPLHTLNLNFLWVY